MWHYVYVILIAGIFPRASSNGAHGSQSDDSIYLVSDMRCSLYLTSRLCSQLQELQELPTSPLRMWSSSKRHQLLLTWAPGPGVEPWSRGTKLMLYHWAIHTSLKAYVKCDVCGLHSWASSQIPRDGASVVFRKKEKTFNIFFNFDILAFFAIKLMLILFKQNGKYFSGAIFWKKEFFFILKFFIYIKKTFFNKGGSKVAGKKLHKLERIFLARHTVDKIFKNPPLLVQAVLKCKKKHRCSPFLSFHMSALCVHAKKTPQKSDILPLSYYLDAKMHDPATKVC